MNTGSSTQGILALLAVPMAASDAFCRSGSKVPRLISSASAARRGFDLLLGDGHRRHRARRQQHVGGEGLRHRVGDAMHPRPPLAQAFQNIGRDDGQIGSYVAFALRRSHLSLRRHDPDQVLWVGFRLSARPFARHPMRLQ
jgi:hypothetical protein